MPMLEAIVGGKFRFIHFSSQLSEPRFIQTAAVVSSSITFSASWSEGPFSTDKSVVQDTSILSSLHRLP